MKNVLNWVKTNWLIVTFCLVMVVSLVAGYIGSNMWAKGQRAEFQTRVQQQMQQVQGARVTYTIPTLTPDEQAVSDSGPPNEVKTRWFAERIRERVAQAERLVEEAEAFNQGRVEGSNRLVHQPLVEGLFPAPADERIGTNLRLDFRDRVIGGRSSPPALEVLLQRFGAGPHANLERVQNVLTDLKDREFESILTETGDEPTDEQQARITQMLTERRIAEYQRASRDISMYATPREFTMTRLEPGTTPPLTQCFAWQWDYWVASDLLAAFAMANTDADGLRTDVANSVVKRINSVRIEPIDLNPPTQDETSMGMDTPAEPVVTITGRTPSNEDYDIRYATVVLTVSSERLPALFDALARTNYMTVTEFGLEQVNAWNDLRAGYYYGSDHVVEVTLKIETVWLRSWTGPLMPASVRQALGVVVPEAPADGGSM